MNPTINDSPAVMDGKTSQRLHGYKTSIEKNQRDAPAPLLGDHSVSDPPDPISNSAVKPDSANGTVAQAPEE